MSFKLLKAGVEVASNPTWSATVFGRVVNTSFPKEVSQDYVWESDDYWLGWVDSPEPEPPTAEEIAQRQSELYERLRLDAYRNESDPLFFKWQRGEVEQQVWLDKVSEIKARYA